LTLLIFESIFSSIKKRERYHMSVFIHFTHQMTKAADRKPVCGGLRALGGEY